MNLNDEMKVQGSANRWRCKVADPSLDLG